MSLGDHLIEGGLYNIVGPSQHLDPLSFPLLTVQGGVLFLFAKLLSKLGYQAIFDGQLHL